MELGMGHHDPFYDPSSIAHWLDFSPRHVFRAKVRDLFATPVNAVSSANGFSMVVSFGRTSFDLNNLNVSIALSACLGAAYDEMRIAPLRGNVFMFDVCSKSVGFLIQKMRSHVSRDFVFYFDLWGSGGPNCQREENFYYQEEDLSWNLVQSQKKSQHDLRSKRFHSNALINSNRSYLQAASPTRNNRMYPLTGANAVPINYRLVYSSRGSSDNLQHDRDSRNPLADDQQAVSGNSNLNDQQQINPPLLDQQPALGPKRLANPVYKPVTCPRCLLSGHRRKNYRNLIKCKVCYNFGHIASSCFNKHKGQRFSWRKVTKSTDIV